MLSWLRGKRESPKVEHKAGMEREEKIPGRSQIMKRLIEVESSEIVRQRKDEQNEQRLERLEKKYDLLQNQWIELLDHQQRILGQLLLSQTHPEKPVVPFAINEREKSGNVNKEGRRPEKITLKLLPQLKSMSADRKMTFKDFIPGKNNRFSHTICQTAALDRTRKYNPLIIAGGTGTGKTHLLHSIANLLEGEKSKKVLLTTYSSIEDDLKRAMEFGRISDRIGDYLEMDAILVDNMTLREGEHHILDHLAQIIEGSISKGALFCITLLTETEDISELESALKGRLDAGIVVELEVPDFEGRRQILSDLAKEEDLSLETEVLDHLALYLDKNVREIQGGFKKVNAYTTIMKEPFSIGTVQKVLEGLPEGKGVVREQKPKTGIRESNDMSSLLRASINERVDISEEDLEDETDRIEKELLEELEKDLEGG